MVNNTTKFSDNMGPCKSSTDADTGSNAWVTCCLNDDSCLEALVLAESLRRVVTSAKIFLFTSTQLTDSIGNLCSETFDKIVEIDFNTEELKGVDPVEFCKLYAWNLPIDKCIYISPDTIVVENCDELFHYPTLSAQIASKSHLFDTSLLVLSPDYKTYRNIKNYACKLKCNNGTGLLNGYMDSWAKNNVGRIIPNHYTFLVHSDLNIDKLSSNIKLIRFVEVKPWKMLRGMGIQQGEQQTKRVSDIWMKIFYEDVLPKSTNMLHALKLEEKFTRIFENGFLESATTKVDHDYLKNSIAIIGHSCRFPAANNIEEYWDLLISGGDGISQIPLERLNENELQDPKITSVQAGYLKCPLDEFDAKFFGISPREAAFMDPQQRLLVEVSWEALENAGINPKELKGSNTAVFTGVWTHDYERIVTVKGSGSDFHHVILGNSFSATSARVSYFLGLNGPNIVTESGCSSSMVSLHLACQSLRRRETNLAIAGGVNLLISRFSYSEVAILSKDAHCKTFDEKADGFARAEGVGAVILKRYSDAIKDGDRVMAIIRGSAVSNEGTTSSFGTPSKHCQEIAIKEAIKDSGVDPLLVDYVEAHGTGTPVGDPIEFAAIASGYSGMREKPLVVGSVKTNIGHTESAAGLAGLIKVILSMQKEIIPPHRNFDTLNPNINLESIPAIIPVEAQKWKKTLDKKRLAGISSFGISGTNVHVIVEEPPELTNVKEIMGGLQESDSRILVLSAKSSNALSEMGENYVNYLNDNPEVNLADLTYTANACKASFKYRLAVIGKDAKEIKEQLQNQNVLASSSSSNENEMKNPKICFLFTGQGSQYSGMAKSLYDSNYIFRRSIDACENIVRNNRETFSLHEILWGNKSQQLEQTCYSQISIFCVEFALINLWKSLGINPEVVLGHSVGEFAAATAAGFMTLEESIGLVMERSRLISLLSLGGMLAIRASKENIKNSIIEFLKEYKMTGSSSWLDIAVVNSMDEIVVAGKKDTLQKFSEFCQTKGIKSHMLSASHAFHSRDMEDMLKDFGTIANRIKSKNPNCIYISGSTGKILHRDSNLNGEYWKRHARDCVNFVSAVKTLESLECNIFIEIGPHPVLLALGMSNINPCSTQNTLWLPSMRKNEKNWTTLLNSASKMFTSGIDLNWKSLDESCTRKKLELPSYPFQRQKYWFESSTDDMNVSFGGKTLHPLLGSKIPSAGSEYLFQNGLNLTNLPYLQDHQVANVFVLPGAGFLEIISAVGKEIFGDEGKFIRVEEFTVEAPLELESGKTHTIQVIAKKLGENSENVFEVTIYMYRKTNGYNDDMGWKKYAHGKVSCCLLQKNCVNITDLLENCTVSETEEFYKKTKELGIIFGETFQSLAEIWKGLDEIIVVIPLPTKAGVMKDYIYHPIVLDAMIQAFGLTIPDTEKHLHLPIAIEKFEMLATNMETNKFYARIKSVEGKSSVCLYDETGNHLAQMEGIKLVRTSVGSFLNVISSQKNKLPGMYNEIWRPRDGPCQQRVDFNTVPSIEEIRGEVLKEMEEPMKSYRFLPLHLKLVNRLSYLHFLKTFLQLNWNPVVGSLFDTVSFMQDLLISPIHEAFIYRILEIFSEEGILSVHNSSEGENEWRVINSPLSLEKVNQKLKETSEKIIENSKVGNTEYIEVDILGQCAEKLASILLGEQTGVSALFSGNTVDISKLYSHSSFSILSNMRAGLFSTATFRKLHDADKIVRILEIGAGSGATTERVLQQLKSANIPYRYTFTDISQTFLVNAANKFSEYNGMDYRVLDISKDPASQGFAPHHYDLIIAANVIHATENLREAVKNVNKLLIPSGFFLLLEIMDSISHIDFIFGVFEGYWCFKDYDIRPHHPYVTQDKWEEVFSECGFDRMQAISDDEEAMRILIGQSDPNWISPTINASSKDCWLLFSDESLLSESLNSQLKNVGKNVHIISKPEFKNLEIPMNTYLQNILNTITSNVEHIIYLWGLEEECSFSCRNLLEIIKFFMISKDIIFPEVFIITKGVHSIGDQGAFNPDQATLWGLIKSAKSERPEVSTYAIDLDPDMNDEIVMSKEIFHSLWASEDDIFIAFRNTKKYVSRVNAFQNPHGLLTLPNVDRFTLTIPTTKSLNDVTYRAVVKQTVPTKHVEIAVKACALNFRDIFVILKPEQYESLFEAVGTDFSGIVTDIGPEVTNLCVGDEVFGISNVTSVASHIIVSSELVAQKPKQFTFSDACTLPSVFITAYYCLYNVAHLQAGETILIHVASGGVGLIAIQLANLIGAKIIATAGSKRKRAYLRSIGIKNVFHSRDTSYGDEIMRVTQGKGVDMVLNSLTGPNFKETSLRVCNQTARFVEMGKVNIWQSEDVKALRPDVKYSIVNLEAAENEELQHLIEEMGNFFKTGDVQPLPYTRFEAAQIKEALNYFMKAQHIGKVVIAMPEISYKNGKFHSNDLIFNSECTYLVTGGLGGIGLEVAKWMVNCGAKNLVLVGRSFPDEKTVKVLKDLNSSGSRVLSFQVNIGDWIQCKNLFSIIQSNDYNLPPLRGIMHSAGALSDAIIINQTWEKYQTVFNAKVQGGWNLHKLTKNLRLEFFVMFSSVAGILGPAGQSNHSAANSFLDSLVHCRHSLGLPAQSINWGAWSSIGAATNTAFGKEGALGVKPFTPTQGIAALKYIVTRPITQVGVIQLEIESIKESFFHLKNYLGELVPDTDLKSNSSNSVAESQTFWSEISSKETVDERTSYLKKHLEGIIRNTLKLPQSEILDEFQTFSEMGLDSLMAVEMRNKLQLMFGKYLTINATSLMDYPNINGLSKFLAELTMTVDVTTILGEDSKPKESHSQNLKSSYELATTDSLLPSNIKDVGGCVKPSEMRKLLLTGVTGHLGAYILNDLIERKNVTIYCLIRAKTVEIAQKRLQSNLKKYNMQNCSLSNVRVILGDICKKNLGFSDEEHEDLSAEIDGIIHCAAKANHLEEYCISKINTNRDIRSVNALGTVNILEFASTKKTKHIFFSTSFTSANEINEKGELLENFPKMENNGEGITMGYSLSKFVCDKLLGQAVSAGIPSKVFRFPTLIGHSETGLFTIDSNHFMAFFLSCSRLGKVPTLTGGWNTLPVDIASRISTKIFFSDEGESGVYNIVQPSPATISELMKAGKEAVGVNTELVEFDEFIEGIEAEGSNSFLYAFKDLYTKKDGLSVLMGVSPALEMSLNQGKDIYAISEKVNKIVPDFVTMIPHPTLSLKRHSEYAKDKGILDAIGIKYSTAD